MIIGDGGDEWGFQPTFRHPTLPTLQSFGNTSDETPDNGLKETLVEYDCHQSVTKVSPKCHQSVTKVSPKTIL